MMRLLGVGPIDIISTTIMTTTLNGICSAAALQEVKSGERERKSKRQPFKKSKETALFKVARGASVARRINIVPEQVKQVDDMLIPRSNRDLFHKLLSAPERVSGTDRGGPPRLFKRSKDTLSKLKF